jgi:uncharacterized protein
MIHPDTELRFVNEDIGHGVFATAFIPKGTIFWVLDPLDHLISADRLEELPSPAVESALKFMFRDREGRYVLCWDHERYVNHSFHPNTMLTPWEFEIAIKDIQPGDQITCDYGVLNIIEPFEPFAEDGARRSVVMPDDLANHHEDWDQLLAAAFPAILTVDQPLRSVLAEAIWDQVNLVCRGEQSLPSLRHSYCG